MQHLKKSKYQLVKNNQISNAFIVDIYNVKNKERLCDQEFLTNLLIEQQKKQNQTIIGTQTKDFNENKGKKEFGVTQYVLLQESHIAIHTYPEYDYQSLDIVTCKSNKINQENQLKFIMENLEQDYRILTISRGNAFKIFPSPALENYIQNTIGAFLIELGKELILVMPESTDDKNKTEEEIIKETIQQQKLYGTQMEILFYLLRITGNRGIFGTFIEFQIQITNQINERRTFISFLEKSKRETGESLLKFKLGDQLEQMEKSPKQFKEFILSEQNKKFSMELEKIFQTQKQMIEKMIAELERELKDKSQKTGEK